VRGNAGASTGVTLRPAEILIALDGGTAHREARVIATDPLRIQLNQRGCGFDGRMKLVA